MKNRYFLFFSVVLAVFSTPVFSGPEEHARDDEFHAEIARLAPVKAIKPRAQVITAADRHLYGTWSSVIQWPHTPVTAANLPNGKIVTFASNQRYSFPSAGDFTYAATYDPGTGQIVEVNHNNHDMFCGHPVMLEDGRPFIMGGRRTVKHTSVFNWQTNQWERKADMNDGRWYPTGTHLFGNKVMIASGSGGTNTVEVGTPEGGFQRLSNINWSPIASAPGFESHWWPLNFLAPNGWVFHAGPTDRMHWVDPNGNGQLIDSGKNVPGNWYPKHSAVGMIDKGKILVAGGAATTGGGSTASVYQVDLNGTSPVITTKASMFHQRRFASGIMLPNGKFFVVGGNTSGAKFSDSGTVFETELYDPATNQWSRTADIAVPRNYHSVALLLPDGRVYAGGGGLNGQNHPANHPDAQIYKPGYFYTPSGGNSVRPTITSAPGVVRAGQTVTVTASANVQRFTMIRMTATTHGLSTDLRFLEVPHVKTGNTTYQLTMDSNPYVLSGGYWMLWALDGNDVPSISKIVKATVGSAPSVAQIGNRSNVAGTPLTLQVQASDPDGDTLTYSATGLPNGLSINSTTGKITGTPTTAQTKTVTVTVADGVEGSDSTTFTWTITPKPNGAPTITNPGNRIDAKGQPVTFTLVASDPDNDPLTFSTSGLPAGMFLNPTTGVISGTPTTAGLYVVSVSVSDGTDSDTANFGWTIRDGLSINPVSGSAVPVGQSVTWNFGPNGGGRTYQVNFGDGSPIQTSTNGTFSHTYSQPGRYTVTVNLTDDAGQSATYSFTQTVHASLTANQPNVSQSIVYEERNGASNRVWNVNPDNNTVSVIDAATFQKITEIEVGQDPRALAIAPDGRIWVTNKKSDSITVLNSTNFQEFATLTFPRGSRPHGIVFDPTNGARAYIALEGTGKVTMITAIARTVAGTFDVGPNPRHLSINHNGQRLYVSRFISPLVPGEDSLNPNPGTTHGGEVVVMRRNGNALILDNTIILQNSTRPDAANAARGIPNYLGPAALSPDNTQAWVASKQDNILRGQGRDGQILNHDRSIRSVSSRINLTNETENQAERIDHDNAAPAVTSLFGPKGNLVYVALEGSRDVAVIDAFSQAEIKRFEVGRAPQGLTVSSDGKRLFVHNFMSRNVTVHNLTELVDGQGDNVPLLATVNVVASETLAPNVLLGKQHFYDAHDNRLALQEYISCASCHNDGGQDGRVWDLTQFGEGLRNTIDLRGKAGLGHGPLHWSANFDEVHDFEGQIRALSGGLGFLTDAQFAATQDPLGPPKAGLSADLDALADYVGSLAASGKSPHRQANGDLTAGGLAGKAIFESEACATCHKGTGFTDSGDAKHDIGTGFNADTPTLRGLWNSAPYLHDGRAATLAAAVTAHNGVNLTSAEIADLTEYLSQIDDNEPAPDDPGGGGGDPAGPNLFSNPRFENNLSSWDTWNPVIITNDASHGTKAARLSFSLLAQGFAVDPSQEYEFFGKYKTAGDTWRGAGVTFYDANGNQIRDEDGLEFQPSASYADFSVEMVSPPNAASAFIWFWCSDGGTLTVDDLTFRTPGDDGGGGTDPGPTANLLTGSTSVTGPFSVEANFSEPVTGITLSDFAVTNGSASGLSAASGSQYFVTITPANPGQVTVSLPAGAGKTADNRDSQASNQLVVSYQDTPPPPGIPESNTFTLTAGETKSVTFATTFNSPVIFTTIETDGSKPPMVARIHNVTSAGYDLTLQRVDGNSGTISNVKVHTVALEEGVYNVGADGVKMEVGKVDLVDSSSAWNGYTFGSEVTPQQSYTNPVVLTQMQSSFSNHWAQAWSRGSSPTEPFKAGDAKLTIGHHTGEDPDTWVDFIESAGYLIIEAGRGTVRGIEFEAGLSPKTGPVAADDTFNIPTSGTMPAAAKVFLSIEGMQNSDGGLPILRTSTVNTIKVKIDEDTFVDDERIHGREAVGWLMLSQ